MLTWGAHCTSEIIIPSYFSSSCALASSSLLTSNVILLDKAIHKPQVHISLRLQTIMIHHPSSLESQCILMMVWGNASYFADYIYCLCTASLHYNSAEGYCRKRLGHPKCHPATIELISLSIAFFNKVWPCFGWDQIKQKAARSNKAESRSIVTIIIFSCFPEPSAFKTLVTCGGDNFCDGCKDRSHSDCSIWRVCN